jgi:hypothetical protein
MTFKATIMSDVMPCSSVEVVLFLLLVCLIFLQFLALEVEAVPFLQNTLIFLQWASGNSEASIFKMLCSLSLH